MTADLVARLLACADEVEQHPHPSHCDHLHVAHKLLREAASALWSSGEAVEPHCSGHERFDYDCIDCSDALERKRKGNAPGDGTYPATPASAWRPIAEAPRDGRVVLVGRRVDPWGWVYGSAYFKGAPGAFVSGWIARGLMDPPGELGLGEPTHWMPLPTPPTSTKGG